MLQAETTAPEAPLKLVRSTIPEAPSDGVLVKTAYAGVCHTDLGYVRDWVDIGGGKRQYRSDFLKKRGEKFEGTVMGHEASGTIVKFGANVTDKCGLEEGDRVAIYPWFGCGDCDLCSYDHNNLCDNNDGGTVDLGLGPNPGGYAEYVPVPKLKFAVKLPESIPLDVACMLPCSGITAYWAVLKSRPHVDLAIGARGHSKVLVIGAGGLGLWGIGLLRATYEGKNVNITAADLGTDKLELAKETGADDVILLKREDDVTTTAAAVTAKGKYDVIIDFVGAESTSQVGMLSVHKAGTVILVGLGGGHLTYPLPRIIFNTITVQGTRTGTPQVLRDIIELLNKSKVNIPTFEYYKLEEANEVLDRLRKGQIKGRALFKFE